MKSSARRVAVLAAAMLVGGLLAPAAAVVAAPSVKAPVAKPLSTHGKASPGFVGKGHLRGVYRALTADVSNTPVAAGALFPPDISWTHDERRDVLEVNDSWVDITLPAGKHVTAGQTLDMDGTSDGTVFHGSDIRTIPGTAASVDTTDVTKTLVILAEWNGKDSITKTKASNVIFTQGNAFWKEVSYGLTSLSGTVVDWVHIDDPGDCYGNGDQLMHDAKLKAVARIGSLSSFERTIVYFPFCASAGNAAGWAYVPGSSVWLNGYMDKRVSLHEQGHNYGLWHAHSVDCSTGALTGSCSTSEYGDEYDTMGSGNWVGHYNVAEKLRLSWMSSRLHTYASSGTSTATIAPLETSTGVKGGRIYGLGGRSYWVEYRTAMGEDRAFPSGGLGLILHMTNGPVGINDGGTNRLDVNRTPDSFDSPTVALAKGASWTSPDHIRITFASSNSSGAQVTVTNGAPQPTVPAAPASVSAKAGDTTALVNWGIPKDGGDAIQGYNVYYQKPGAAAQKKAVNSGGGLIHATTLTGLANNVTYAVWARARNGVGESALSLKVAVLPKIQVPTAVLTAPTSGQLVNADTTTFTAMATVNALSKKPISTVDFYVDGQFYQSDYTAPYSVVWDGTYEADKAYSVQAWATDTNNRVGKSAPVTFTLKKPVPTVTIKSISASGSAPNIVDVHLGATSGSPQATVDYVTVTYEGGNFVGSVDSPSSLSDFVIHWDTHYVEDGSHVLTATVGNSTGRSGTSAPFGYAVVHPTPHAAITSPNEGTTQYGNFTVTATASPGESGGVPGAAIQYVEIITDTNTWVGADYDGSDGWSVDVQAYQLTVGAHTFVARATDGDGFVGISPLINVAFQKPTPTISITSPTANQQIYGNQPGATFDVVTQPVPSVNAGTPTQSVEIRVDGVTVTNASPNDFAHPEGLWTAQLALTSLSEGAHTLTARVADSNQYTGDSAEVPIDVKVPSPSVSLNTVSCPNSPCDVAFTVSANATPSLLSGAAIEHVEFLVDGVSGPSDTDGTDGWGAMIDPINFDSRSHAISARAVDVNGYQQVTPTQSLVFQTPGPTASLSSPTDGTTTVVSDPAQPTAVTGHVFPAASPNDSPISTIELQMDGSYLDSRTGADITNGSQIDFNPVIPLGTHLLVLAVTDEAGRTRHSGDLGLTLLAKPQPPYGYAQGGDGLISYVWYPPYDTGGAAVASYKVTMTDPAGIVAPVVFTQASDPAAASFSHDFPGVPAGVDRAVSVVAITSPPVVGPLQSDPSDPSVAQAYDYTPPPAVTALTGRGTTSGVNLSWTRPTPSSDIKFQDVYVEAGPNAYLYSAPSTLDGTKTSKLVTGLATTGDYTASVVTRDAAGNNGPTTSVLIRATSVAITRTVSTVTYGGTSTLNAKLTMVTGGAVLKSGSIIFYSRKKGVGSYVAVVTKPINAATGLASYVVKPSTNTEYLARYNGGTNLFGRTSGVTNVLVKPKIVSKITNTSGATITSSRYGSYVYFKATVSPNHKAQYVYLQRYTSAGWKNVVRVTLSTYSAISYRYRLLAKGTFKYRIYKGADSDHVVTTGATLTLKVT